MASICVIRSKDNTKKYKVTYDLPRTPQGERVRKSKTFPAGTPKSLVLNFKREVEVALATGELQAKKDITLYDFVENIYFKDYVKFLSPATVKSYRQLFENSKEYAIKTYFGDYKVTSITRQMVQEYANRLSDSLSPRGVRNYTMWLHSLFDTAITIDLLKPNCNPVDYIKLPPKKSAPIEPFTAEQVQKMFELAKDDLTLMLILGLGTLAGLRKGEMCALPWKNVFIDDDMSEIRIEQSRVAVYDEVVLKDPKTAAGNRTIYIPEQLKNILLEARTEYRKNQLLYGKDFSNEGYVLSMPNGHAFFPNSIANHYVRFMKDIAASNGIPYKSLHKLRHTYTSLCLESGASIKGVQKSLGHSSMNITLSVYAHSYDDRRRSDAEKLSATIFGDTKTG